MWEKSNPEERKANVKLWQKIKHNQLEKALQILIHPGWFYQSFSLQKWSAGYGSFHINEDLSTVLQEAFSEC